MEGLDYNAKGIPQEVQDITDTRPRVVIGATHSGAGKTTVTLLLMGALKRRGFDVRPFKVGPDFIDPSHHRMICGHSSHNLDSFMMSEEQIRSSFMKYTSGDSIAVIEGVMGLYDGMDGKDEKGSTAHISKILKAPVILVIDGSSLSRSAGAIALGYRAFDSGVNLRGVILNRVGSRRHEEMLRDAIEEIVPVVGVIPKKSDLIVSERHLGLKMGHEVEYDHEMLADLGSEYIDIESIIKIAGECEELGGRVIRRESVYKGCKIGVARDRAFCFYYPENIEIMRELGAEVVEFSPMEGSLPDVDGVYLGGGYPELYAEELEQNEGIREEIKRRVEEGMPLYAECGGMMYTLRKVNGYEMLGVFDAEAELTERLQAVGYVVAESLSDTVVSRKGEVLRGHEFHYSVVHPGDVRFAYRMIRGKGIKDRLDGMVYKNVLASYTHIHAGGEPSPFEEFVRCCYEQ